MRMPRTLASKGQLSADQLRQFMAQCRTSQSLDFPRMATDCGYSWLKQVKPRLEDTAWFREDMEAYLVELRFKLVDTLHSQAIGHGDGGKALSAAPILAIMKIIDSGILLGSQKPVLPDAAGDLRSEEEVKEQEKAKEKELRERLGI